jgi:hypothetical protein
VLSLPSFLATPRKGVPGPRPPGRSSGPADVDARELANVLREAVVWYELRQESRADPKDAELPRWVCRALRLLPSAGLSRWARFAARTLDDAEADLTSVPRT